MMGDVLVASFTVRVELHDPSPDSYDVLHEAMEYAGFERTVVISGVTYRLPTAEYILPGANTMMGCLTKARTAAKKTKLRHSILVTDSKRRLGFGLDEV
jgi:hypothetical protein